jgi:hypothetical protein
MLTRALAAALTLMFAIPSSAEAESGRMFQALPARACGTPLAETGKAIPLKEPLSEVQRNGLMAGLFLTLHDPTGQGWSEADIKAASACPMARFAADDVIWTIQSGAGNAPVRLITSSGREEAYFLVRGPALADAAAWSTTRRGVPGASTPPAYYLLADAGNSVYSLIQIYDGPPPMTLVADDIAAISEPGRLAIATYGESGSAVTLLRRVAQGSQAELFRPADLGETGATIYLPDGRFVSQSGGDFVFRGSGFACRPAYGKFERTTLLILNTSDETLELGCGLETEESWTMVYATRMPAARDKAYMAERIKSEEEAVGVARKYGNLPTGRGSPLQGGRVWVDSNGAVQMIVFIRRGEYLFEIRQTATPADADSGGDTVVELMNQIAAAPSDEPNADAWRSKR